MRRTASGIGVILAVALVLPGALGAIPQGSPVADAAQRGETETVRTLLQQGADVSAAQGDGMTALHWAALDGHLEMARMLLYAGANVRATTRLGDYTPLLLAARTGEPEMIDALLRAGADPDTATSTGATPLMFAAAAGSTEALGVLLDAGAAIDATEAAQGQTALMFAAAANRVAAVELLVQRGADLTATSAVVDIVEKAAEASRRRRGRSDDDEDDEDDGGPAGARGQGQAGARAAGRGGPAAQLNNAAGGNPDPSTQLNSDETDPRLVGQAAEEGDEDARGAGRQGETDEAAGNEESDETDEAAGNEGSDETDEADDDEESDGTDGDDGSGEDDASEDDDADRPLGYDDLVAFSGGMTPLHYAARQGHMETARALVEAGADVDQPTAGDHTSPLLMATINGHFDLGLYLLEQGADPNLASLADATPLYAALNVQWAPKALYPQPRAHLDQSVTHIEYMRALLEAGADPDARINRKIWYSSYNFDLSGVNERGATPFWRAAYGLDVEAMKLLVEHGADPTIPTRNPPSRRRRGGDDDDEPDPSGLPPVPVGGPAVAPLHAATGVGYGESFAANSHNHVPEGWMPAVRYLVEELGADVDVRDQDGYTPLHHAAARGDNEMILYLVSKGADVTVVSRRGQTVADMANGPQQRVQPFYDTVALLEMLGSKNNHACVSC